MGTLSEDLKTMHVSRIVDWGDSSVLLGPPQLPTHFQKASREPIGASLGLLILLLILISIINTRIMIANIILIVLNIVIIWCVQLSVVNIRMMISTSYVTLF